MKKISWIFIAFSFLLFAACSFDVPVSMAPASPVKGETREQARGLERRELLALLSLEPNLEVDPEQLQDKLTGILEINANARTADRGAASSASVITNVHKFTIDFTTAGMERSLSIAKNSSMALARHKASEIPFYLFSIENSEERTSGYILASGDLRLPSILAVVESGEFDMDIEGVFTSDENDGYGDNAFKKLFYTNLAEYTIQTMDMYDKVSAMDVSAVQEKDSKISGSSREIIVDPSSYIWILHPSPLIKTKWSQDSPVLPTLNLHF